MPFRQDLSISHPTFRSSSLPCALKTAINKSYFKPPSATFLIYSEKERQRPVCRDALHTSQTNRTPSQRGADRHGETEREREGEKETAKAGQIEGERVSPGCSETCLIRCMWLSVCSSIAHFHILSLAGNVSQQESRMDAHFLVH